MIAPTCYTCGKLCDYCSSACMRNGRIALAFWSCSACNRPTIVTDPNWADETSEALQDMTKPTLLSRPYSDDLGLPRFDGTAWLAARHCRNDRYREAKVTFIRLASRAKSLLIGAIRARPISVHATSPTQVLSPKRKAGLRGVQ